MAIRTMCFIDTYARDPKTKNCTKNENASGLKVSSVDGNKMLIGIEIEGIICYVNGYDAIEAICRSLGKNSKPYKEEEMPF